MSAVSAASLPSLDPKYGVLLPPARAGNLLKQCSRDVPANITGVWRPSSEQIHDLESRLPAALMAEWPNHIRTDLNASSTYNRDIARQYAGFLIGGKQIIYVNAFPLSIVDFDGTNLSPAAKVDWHRDAIMVCDGGDRFWGVEYDPSTKTFSHFSFNGAI
jgi:hypothetical protein